MKRINKPLDGIFTALLTPFDQNDRVNEKALEQLVKYNLEKGVTGFYVGGTTAEAFLLSTAERMQVMEVVAATAPNSTLIAHVGSLNLNEAIELGRRAEALNYDVVSSVAPFYYKFSFEEVKSYYRALAKAVPMPLLVYYFPAYSGVSMGAPEMGELLGIESAVGFKFTSNDFFMMERCKSQFPDKVVYNGYDEMFLAGLSMGANGGIGSTYNFMAEKFVKIKSLFEQNLIAQAQEIQAEVNRIISVLCKVGVMPAEKEVLNQLGLDFGHCRLPFSRPTEEQKKLIATEIIPYL